MNGVISASVSPGSSHRETSVTCTPMTIVPSGGAAGAGAALAISRTEARASKAIGRRAGIRHLQGKVPQKLPHLAMEGEEGHRAGHADHARRGDVHRARRGETGHRWPTPDGGTGQATGSLDAPGLPAMAGGAADRDGRPECAPGIPWP